MMSALFSSSLPPPTFTDASLIDLSTKVYIITSATSGNRLALARILYCLHATVYIGAHSPPEYDVAFENIKQTCPDSKGSLKPFIFDAADLATIRPVVEKFLEDEWRLDVLFLNPNITSPTASNKSKPTQDLTPTTTFLAPFLLTTLLLPLMQTTTSHFCHPNPSIRVIWVSSSPNEGNPANGIQFNAVETGATKYLNPMDIYLLAHEFSHHKHDPEPQISSHTLPNSNPSGVQHITVNPVLPHLSIRQSLHKLMSTMSKAIDYGEYTLLYAGLAPDVRDGDCVVPWGRRGRVPEHIRESTEAKQGGEKSGSARMYEWCKEQVRAYE